MYNGDYAAAQQKIEKTLQTDPKNIYALRIYPSVLAGQIKRSDKSPANIALVRKTIEVYRRAMDNPLVSAAEKKSIDAYLPSLYGSIGEDELINELVRRAGDPKRPSEQRSELYIALASRSWNCSYQITYQRTQLEASEIDKAKACTTQGLDYVKEALALNANSEAAWSYKGNLLKEAARIAGMENNPAQQTKYGTEAKEALRRAEELSQEARKRDEQSTPEEAQPETSASSDDEESPDQVNKELTTYRTQESLDTLIKEVYVEPLELTTLVAPVPVVAGPAAESYSLQEDTKRARLEAEAKKGVALRVRLPWKTLSLSNEEIVLELPDNVRTDVKDNSRIYEASSEGITYTIYSQPRSTLLADSADDAILNALARAAIFTLSHLSSGGDPWHQQVFEAKLLRKESASGRPARVYSLALSSCGERLDGALVVYAGKTRNYIVQILGAGETDARVQHFLKSVRFK
jgi:archaellum component FlaD/FlaE